MTDKAFQKAFAKEFVGLKKVVDDATARILTIVRRAIEKPQRSNAFWNGIMASVDNEYNTVLRTMRTWMTRTIPKEFATAFADVVEQVRKTQGIVFDATTVLENSERQQGIAALTSRLRADALKSMASAISNGRVMVTRITRLTQQRLVSEYALDSALAKAYESGDIRNFAAILAEDNPTFGKLYNTLIEGRVVEAGGRHYTPSYYAEMVGRTRFHEVQADAALSAADSLGTDLVVVSNHNTTTELCKEHEGQIYSVSGNSDKYPPLTDTPPFHPNCLHTLYPYFD